jgi:hypothetical protein
MNNAAGVINKPLDQMTLQELEVMRAYWVNQNLPFCKDLENVIRTMGQVVLNHNVNRSRFVVDNLICYTNQSSEGYDTAKKEYQITTHLFVFLDRDGLDKLEDVNATRLVSLSWVNFGTNKHEKDNLFVPGAWMDKFIPLIEKTTKHTDALKKNAQETERRSLLSKLAVTAGDFDQERKDDEYNTWHGEPGLY